MRLAFTGSRNTRRLVRGHVWSAENGHVTEVPDPVLCAELITTPEFRLADDEPLFQLGLDRDQVASLCLFGIGSLADLANLNNKGITALAGFAVRSEKTIRAWVNRAKQLMEV